MALLIYIRIGFCIVIWSLQMVSFVTGSTEHCTPSLTPIESKCCWRARALWKRVIWVLRDYSTNLCSHCSTAIKWLLPSGTVPLSCCLDQGITQKRLICGLLDVFLENYWHWSLYSRARKPRWTVKRMCHFKEANWQRSLKSWVRQQVSILFATCLCLESLTICRGEMAHHRSIARLPSSQFLPTVSV